MVVLIIAFSARSICCDGRNRGRGIKLWALVLWLCSQYETSRAIPIAVHLSVSIPIEIFRWLQGTATYSRMNKAGGTGSLSSLRPLRWNSDSFVILRAAWSRVLPVATQPVDQENRRNISPAFSWWLENDACYLPLFPSSVFNFEPALARCSECPSQIIIRVAGDSKPPKLNRCWIADGSLWSQSVPSHQIQSIEWCHEPSIIRFPLMENNKMSLHHSQAGIQNADGIGVGSTIPASICNKEGRIKE